MSKFEGFRACASLRDNYRKLRIWVSSVHSGKVFLFGQFTVAKVATFGWPKASLRLAGGQPSAGQRPAFGWPKASLRLAEGQPSAGRRPAGRPAVGWPRGRQRNGGTDGRTEAALIAERPRPPGSIFLDHAPPPSPVPPQKERRIPSRNINLRSQTWGGSR